MVLKRSTVFIGLIQQDPLSQFSRADPQCVKYPGQWLTHSFWEKSATMGAIVANRDGEIGSGIEWKGFNGVVFGKAARSVSAGAPRREASHWSDRTESLPVDPPHRRRRGSEEGTCECEYALPNSVLSATPPGGPGPLLSPPPHQIPATV